MLRAERAPSPVQPPPPQAGSTSLAVLAREHGLLGRDRELARVARLLADARDSCGGALALVGEPGVGKTALLRLAEQMAAGAIVLRTVGIEHEASIPYAALHSLINPLLPRATALRPRHAAALHDVLGMVADSQPDPVLVGQAFHSLLTGAGSVMCVVDDAQWLDPASADVLFFAARRIQTERTAVLVAARDDWTPHRWGLETCHVPALTPEASAELANRFGPELSIVDRDTVLAQAQGNPLAIREMVAALTSERAIDARAYLFGQAPMPVKQRVEAMFAGSIAKLPDRARQAVVVAAAAGLTESAAIDAACRRLASSVADLAAAEQAGLVTVTEANVAFRHPLVRSAAYQSASVSDRARAHRALADVMEERGDQWRRTWHLASSTIEPDEDLAALLTNMADTACRSARSVAVASAYERAAELSSQPTARATRRLMAARSAFDAGCRAWAGSLVQRVDRHELDPVNRAQMLDLEAALIWHQDHPTAISRVLEMAFRTVPHASDVAEQQIYEVTLADWTTGSATATAGLQSRLDALAPAIQVASSPRLRSAVALETLATGDVETGIAELAGIRAWLLDADATETSTERLLGRMYRPYLGLLLANVGAASDAAQALVDACRSRGELTALPFALSTKAQVDIWAGRMQQAEKGATDALALSEELGQVLDKARIQAELMLYFSSIRGEDARCGELADQAGREGSATTRDAVDCRLALLALGRNEYETALRLLHPIVTGPRRHTLPALSGVADYIEAAAFLNEPGPAEPLLNTLSAWAQATHQPWIDAIAIRSEALLANGAEAGSLLGKAMAVTPRDTHPFERARTSLLFGGWLRRHRQKTEARRVLHAAHREFDRLGAKPWTDRALSELRAAGESTGPAQHHDTIGALTPQELQVARHAATGMTNREIGTRLFLSPRTVGYHLYKAYPKLGITSRHELARLKLDGEPGRPPRKERSHHDRVRARRR